MKNQVLFIDDILGDFGGVLTKQRYHLYCYRALYRLGEIALVFGPLNDDLHALLSYLSEMGIGPKNVHVLPTSSNGNGLTLYDYILSDADARERVLHAISNGCKIQVFMTSQKALGFAHELGLDWDTHFVSPSIDAASLWNSKVDLRLQASRTGLKDLFPRFVLCFNQQELCSAMQEFSDGSYVVKLKSDAASGEGMIFMKNGTPPAHLYEGLLGVAIVEEFIPHIPFSVTFNITGKEISFSHASVQSLTGVAPGQYMTLDHTYSGAGEHKGNVVGCSLGPVAENHISATVESLLPLVRNVIVPSGYQGKINFDLGLSKDGQAYLFEANARISHSMIVQDVREALECKLGRSVVVCGCNIFPKEKKGGFIEARTALANAGLLFDGTGSGLFPYHTELWRRGYGQAGLFAVGETFEEAVSLFNQGETLFCK